MPSVIIRIPTDEALLCDARVAEVGDSADVYIDEVKYPAATTPIRGVITDITEPEGGDPLTSTSVLWIEIETSLLPLGLGTLESCDVVSIACADCCLRNQERLTDIENNAVYYFEDTGGAWTLDALPSDVNALANDDATVFVRDTTGTGYIHLWNPENQQWHPLTGVQTHDPSTGAPAANQNGEGMELLMVGTQGSFDGQLWYPGDVGVNVAGAWEKTGILGSYEATAVTLSGTQTISGAKTFTNTLDAAGILIVQGSFAFITPTIGGELSGAWQSNADITTIGGTWTFDATSVLAVASDSVSFTGLLNTHSATTTNFAGVTVDFTGTTNPVLFSETTTSATAVFSDILEHSGADLGFYGTTPISQPVGVADATGGATVDAEARVAINLVITRLESLGLIATI